jgi:hypothetical protein
MVATAAVAILSTFGGVSSATASTTSPLSIRIVLHATTATAGRALHGTAVLTNSSSKSIRVNTWECDQWLFVGLANKSAPYNPVVATAACSATVSLKPGVNLFPITVSTKYQVCEMSGAPATGDTPQCTKSGMPSLPKGTYRVAVITNGLPKGTSISARIRVTLS